MSNLVVGSKVRLLRPILGERQHAIGYVVDEYTIGKRGGVSIIFQDGGFDGFSEDDQKLCLEDLGVDPRYSTYEFNTVGQVQSDRRKGHWDFLS